MCGGGGGGGGMLIKWNSPICDELFSKLHTTTPRSIKCSGDTHHPGESTYRVHCSQTFHIIKS